MNRRSVLAVGIAAGLTLILAGSALAGSLPAPNSGTISPYVPGPLAAASAQPSYGRALAFTTTGATSLKNPRVWVSCSQNGVVVYGAGGSPTEVFKLGGDMSQWVLNGGGPAACSAQLYYILNAKGTGEWSGHGGQGGTVTLADTTFSAAG